MLVKRDGLLKDVAHERLLVNLFVQIKIEVSPKNKLMEDPYLIPNTFRDPEVEPYTIRSQNGEIYSLLRDYNTQRQRTFSDDWSSNWEALF